MIKYAKVINEKTKQCSVGLDTNKKVYQSIGMSEMDVEQAWNGDWYLSGYAPKKPLDILEEEKRAQRNDAINAILWRVERYNQQKQLGIETTDSESEYMSILRYIQYLRDLPANWDFLNLRIKTFEEYKGE